MLKTNKRNSFFYFKYAHIFICMFFFQMWSLEYVQVPIERKLKRTQEVTSVEKPASQDSDDSKPAADKSKKLDLFKQMSLSAEGNGKLVTKTQLCKYSRTFHYFSQIL